MSERGREKKERYIKKTSHSNEIKMATSNERNGGGNNNNKEDKNNDSSSSGNEVTAEWVVRAQLKITKPKKKKAASFASGDCGARRSSGSPCRVIYKWTSDGKSQDHEAQQNITNIFTEKVRSEQKRG